MESTGSGGGTRVGSFRTLCALAAACALLAPQVQAQDGTSSRPRVTITGSFGYMASGPASGFEAMLEAGGFADFLDGGCRLSGCTVDENFPQTASDPGPGSNLRISYSQWSRFEVALSTGTATPSNTFGYSQESVPDFGRYSVVESHLRMYAATAGVRMGPVSIGVGPASYRLRATITDEDNPFAESTESTIGGLLDAGGQFQLFKRVIFDLRLQYRFVGATDMGPYQLESRTLPATPVDFTHAFIGFGIGLAF